MKPKAAQRPHGWNIALSIAAISISVLTLLLQQCEARNSRNLMQRAWMQVRSADIDLRQKLPTLRLLFTNDGPTPANIVLATVWYTLEDPFKRLREGEHPKQQSKDEGYGLGTVSSHGATEVYIEAKDWLNWKAQVHEGYTVAFHGFLTYRDIFLNEHKTQWCYYM